MTHAGLDYTDRSPDDGPQDPASGDLVRLVAHGANRLRLDRFLVDQLAASPAAAAWPALSRSRIQRWIALGAVRVDGSLVPASHRLKGLEQIEVSPLPLESEQAFRPEPVDFTVVHADDDVAVIDKPAGLVTHPAPGHWQGTLMNGLLHRFPGARELPRAGIVHRLDRETSGLIACALSERGFASLTRQLAERSMKRVYLAVMPAPAAQDGRIQTAIGRDPRDRLRMAVLEADRPGAKPARTDWRVLARAGGQALVECRLHTGRTHQIRVHFASIGHPLVGDPLYGGATPRRPQSGPGSVGGPGASGGAAAGASRAAAAAAQPFTRQALHAWRLRFDHPDGSGPREFTAPPPEDFLTLLAGLGLALPVDRPA